MTRDAIRRQDPARAAVARKPRVPGLGANFGYLAAPPALPRIVARAQVLCAQLLRGELEVNAAREDAEPIASTLQEWLLAAGADAELEPVERATLQAGWGTLHADERERCGWLGEGAAVLAWALRRSTLPPPGVHADGSLVAEAVGLLSPEGGQLGTRAQLRPRESLLAALEVLELAAARLREALDSPARVSLARWRPPEFPWPEDIAPCGFVDDDLAIEGLPLAAVDAGRRYAAWRGAAERQRAARWLLGAARLYSEADREAP